MKTTIILLLICVTAFAQQKGTFTDSRDGKTYKTVKIGSQTWMAENLNYHGEDGFLGLCYGDEPKEKIRKPENCKKYGRLYNWPEAMNACPKGWHLPDTTEWQTLVDFAGGDEVAGKKLKAKSGWEKPLGQSKCKWTEEKIDDRGRVTIIEHDKCNTDEYGFSALPGGGYYYNKHQSIAKFDDVGNYGLWWSARECEPHEHIPNARARRGLGTSGKVIISNCAYHQDMYYYNDKVNRDHYHKSVLFSVRCLQD